MDAEAAGRRLTELALRCLALVKSRRVVVGLSGGADSTLVLLAACRMRELSPGLTVAAVHCVHGLDADDPLWLAHCAALARSLRVDEFSAPRLRIARGRRQSLEEESRRERYRALLEHLKGGALLLGHQADDAAEGLLLALKRGSGPRGLAGMSEYVEDRRGVIIRPLLNLRKAEIERLVALLGYDFVYDASNSCLKFERNFIRLKVLPLLRSRFPGIDRALLRSARLCALEHELAVRFIEPIYNGCRCLFRGDPALKLSFDLSDETLALSLVRRFLAEGLTRGSEYAQAAEALRLARTGPDTRGLIRLEAGLNLRRFRDYLVLVPELRLPPAGGSFTLRIGAELRLGDYRYALRPAAGEDRAFEVRDGVTLDFAPHGSLRLKPRRRAHSRELKKLLAEYGIPLWQRPLMCLVRNAAGEILAVGDIFATGPAPRGGWVLAIARER